MAAVQMPRFEVKLIGREPFEVTITNGSQVRFDEERSVRNWPAMDEGQALWASFVCWASATRRGLVEEGMPWEVWRDDVESLDYLKAVEARPTLPAPVAGSSAK